MTADVQHAAPDLSPTTRPFTEAAAAAARVLAKLRHDPAGIAMTLGAPVVMVLIFGYVFGSAIALPGGPDASAYREFLVPGLFVVLAFNPVPSMVTMARDAGRGAVDRFRSLPIARAAIPFGQATATTLYGALCLVLMMICGLVVGWRVHDGFVQALAAVGLLILVQHTFTWVGLYLGLVIGKEETAGQLSVLVFPLTMLSNVFVPTAGMPAWLRAIADWNPISVFTAAVRELFGNPTAPTNGAWPLENAVLATMLWSVLLLVIFVPLTVRRYARPAA
ncbi:ABC transporter permease [Cumulibacter soli]|uniref:ABC transporter permease n=1 Tax=Cumulibacter soli TaxID=2546344 RepID=UPI00106795CA|nr:ABC transporter permease [Cumulibacter soli]